jgi:hypothetical protein
MPVVFDLEEALAWPGETAYFLSSLRNDSPGRVGYGFGLAGQALPLTVL